MGHRRDMPRVGAKVGPQQSPGFGPCCGSRIGTHRKGTLGNPILWHRTNSPTTHHVRISIVKTRSQPIGGAEGARATGTLRNRFDKHKWSNGWHRPTFRLIQLGQKCRICREKRSARGRTRTCDLLIRSQTLYPAELRAHRNLHDTAGWGISQGRCFFENVFGDILLR